MTDSEHLANAMVWCATSPEARNEVFNITNGDFFRWQHVWTKFAQFFEMEYAEPQTISLTDFMADKAPLWEHIVQKYDLVPHTYKDLVAWPFGDYVFGCDWDIMSDTLKIRRHGFHECVDSEEMFLRLFRQFQEMKVIP